MWDLRIGKGESGEGGVDGWSGMQGWFESELGGRQGMTTQANAAGLACMRIEIARAVRCPQCGYAPDPLQTT